MEVVEQNVLGVVSVMNKDESILEKQKEHSGYTAPKERFIYRVKFTKAEEIKFIGHLDIMRIFQRAIRRAKLPVAYSKGFNPHQLLSFASPLTLGMTSEGEYGDFEMTQKVNIELMIKRLNQELPDGMEVKEAVLLENGVAKAMASVEAAVYKAHLNYQITNQQIEDYLAQKEILVLKKTKHNLKQENIREDIYKLEKKEENEVFLFLASGSKRNLKPELVIESLYTFLNIEYHKYTVVYTRVDLFHRVNDILIPLSKGRNAE